jgi:ribosome biogenesis GTPase
MSGIVRRSAGGVYEIELDSGEVVDAALRGRLKMQARTGDRVVTGDRVQIERHDDGSTTIEEVEPRSTQLARMSPRQRGRRASVIVANVDQVVVVLAAARPEPKLRMLDRFLVLSEANDIPAIVVVNKSDLLATGEVAERFRDYTAAGYEVLETSAKGAIGIEQLRERLCGRISVFTGPSGVGKSTLLNALEPGLKLRTGDVSEAVGKGKHTTTTAELIPLRCGGYVADTPGLREVGLWDVETESLDECFPEFAELRQHCRFTGSCTHIHEPKCGIREAVAAGTVSAARYESYRTLRLGENSD